MIFLPVLDASSDLAKASMMRPVVGSTVCPPSLWVSGQRTMMVATRQALPWATKVTS